MSEPGAEDDLHELHRALRDRGATLATAESLTGGLLAVRMTSVPGSSASYVGGVVTYATELKMSLLDVPREVVEGPGVVSAECAEAMARGAREIASSTYAVATTGVAGPERQEGKPVGTVYVGVAGPRGAQAYELDLDGEREEIQAAACEQAVSLVLAYLTREESAVG
jgi:nicotinamide-nucleotide amidase